MGKKRGSQSLIQNSNGITSSPLKQLDERDTGKISKAQYERVDLASDEGANLELDEGAELTSDEEADLAPDEGVELGHMYESHLRLLQQTPQQNDVRELTDTPIFTAAALNYSRMLHVDNTQVVFPQYALLAGLIPTENIAMGKGKQKQTEEDLKDPRVFFNIASPSSVFICGSQGSGKSHTLSCLLENCLMTCSASVLPSPLTGLVFHYDTFISDDGGSPCEAAFLSSNPNIKVRVLCSPTNFRTIQLAYHALDVEIEPLELDEGDLNTKRMLDLMAVSNDDGPVPLYIHTVYRILREMRRDHQLTRVPFNYGEFKRQVMKAGLNPGQRWPLQQRLDMLESFMAKDQTSSVPRSTKKPKVRLRRKGNDWTPKPGYLTIVDLSCPCVTPESACSLFNICLSIFLEQQTSCGRVVALDEAHKYMNSSAEASTLTNSLLSTIRLQRHLGTRVFISTQEPTISPRLLDLSSVSIVHRFTSPDWWKMLKKHLAGASLDHQSESARVLKDDGPKGENAVYPHKGSTASGIFEEIVSLNVGEALLFAPNAVVGSDEGRERQRRNGEEGEGDVKRLGAEYLKIAVRARLTLDGGQSVRAA